jgi:hypothetical protein
MNLYLRYFDQETLVYSVEEALIFCTQFQRLNWNPVWKMIFVNMSNSDVFYPKRYKVRQGCYFIIIKTEAATMARFQRKKGVAFQTIVIIPMVKKHEAASSALMTS